jgi:DNA-binding IclR family transcriptional regulator
MRVLELLADHPEGLNLVEIAAALDLPVNSTQRIALAFCEMGYAQRDLASKRFFLTSKMLSVGSRGLGESSLIERSLDVMRELRDAVRETVLLFLLSGHEVVLLEQVLSLYSFKFMVDPGSRWPLHTNAPGKALWAFLPQPERNALLAHAPFPPRTARTITSGEAMAAELDRVYQSGCAFDLGEDADGCNCAAAPVLDRRGYPVAAICVSGPANRFTESMLPQAGVLVKAHAARVSQRCGYAPAR